MVSKYLITILTLVLVLIDCVNCADEDADTSIKVELVDVADNYIVIKIIAPIYLNDSYINGFAVKYQQANNLKETFIEVNDRPKVQTVQLSGLEPNEQYRISVSAKYNETYLSDSNQDFDVTMKTYAPKSALTKEVRLHLNGNKVANYHIQVDRIKGINQLESGLSATLEASFGDVFTLNLISGERYSVQVWYTDTDGRQSAATTTTYVV